MSINDLVSRSEQARGAGRMDLAESLCQTGLAQVPNHGALLFEFASTAFAAGRSAAALKRFRRVGILLPGAGAVHFNIGVCARSDSDHKTACRAFQKVLVLDPRAAGALDSLAHSRLELDQADAAETLASRQLLLNPTSAKALATIGFIAWKTGCHDNALPALKAALILEPGGHDVDMNLANVLLQSDHNHLAIKRFRRLAKQRPNDPAAWLNLGVALISTGDWNGASAAYARLVRLNRGRPVCTNDKDPFPDLSGSPITPATKQTAWHALKFASQQLRYLLDRKLVPPDFETEAGAYQTIMEGLNDARRRAISFELTDEEMHAISRYHGRLVHLSPTEWSTPAGPALNPRVDWNNIETTYQRAKPALAVVDNFLDPLALSALRKFCLESTIWFEMKGAGYLGAYFRDGFNDPLLLAIAEQLTQRLPHIFANHPLRMIWAYTYEQSMVGINPHADFARINVNFWITPDSANLDPETGGLLIYRRPAPESWGFEQYNAAPGDEIKRFLGDDAHTPIRVPHRQNRAVIFDSRLFHETDRLTFQEGIENRRINITMLFGGR